METNTFNSRTLVVQVEIVRAVTFSGLIFVPSRYVYFRSVRSNRYVQVGQNDFGANDRNVNTSVDAHFRNVA